jgi:outer membrane autotransporter protein
VTGGTTSINIVPFAPSTSPAATTGNGYELVRVGGNVASNAFQLSGPVIHGGYEYLLHYLPNYAGTTDGFFLQSAPLQQTAINAAMLAIGRTSKGLCEREDTSHPGLEGKRYRVSGDVRVGNYSAGEDTGMAFDADHYCLSASADAAVNRWFFLGMSGAWGNTDADAMLQQGKVSMTGTGGRYQAHAGLTLGDFYAVIAAGFAKTEWEAEMVGGGQLSADIKGGVGHLDAGYRLAFDRQTALTLSGRVDYDGTTCGDNCLIIGTVESITELSGRAGLRLDTSWWNGSFRPFVAVGVSDDFGDGTSVTMLGATASSDAMSMVLDADIGFNAKLDDGADVFVRGRMISGLDKEVDGYEAAGGVRLMW